MIQEDIFPPCPVCGIGGLHACPGKPVTPWTEQEKKDLMEAMKLINDREELKDGH